MDAMPQERFIYLRDKLTDQCERNMDINTFQKLKCYYEGKINSVRRLEYITNLKELIRVLDKRGFLTPKNTLIFSEIAQICGQTEVLNTFDNTINIQRRREYVETVPQTIQDPPNYQVTTQPDVKAKIHLLICRQLGKSWIDFARALDIQECRIDELKLKYRNDMKMCIAEVLEHYETDAHPRVWRTQLLEALSKSRRNDLRKSVQNIFDTYM